MRSYHFGSVRLGMLFQYPNTFVSGAPPGFILTVGRRRPRTVSVAWGRDVFGRKTPFHISVYCGSRWKTLCG
jgi:hypothetical protein